MCVVACWGNVKCKMGYWPSVRSRWLDIGQVLFFYVFKLAKKEWGQYLAILTKQTSWSIKNLLYGFWGNVFLWDTAGSPEQVRWLPLGQPIASHIWFILPAHRASHIIKLVMFSWRRKILNGIWQISTLKLTICKVSRNWRVKGKSEKRGCSRSNKVLPVTHL